MSEIILNKSFDFCGSFPGKEKHWREAVEIMANLLKEMAEQDCMTVKITKSGQFYTHVQLEFLSPAA